MAHQHEPSNFTYTYSAKEQAELKRIREKYAPSVDPREDKMARLRYLDSKATRNARCVSLVLGIVGILVLGFGMSLAMTDFGSFLAEPVKMAVGVIVGVVGIGVCALAYPVYQRVSARRRTRVSEEILKLTEELLKK